jgi:twitching motility protein PilT
MAQIDEILKIAKERGASDLHLCPGLAPLVRVNGELIPLTEERLARDGLQLMLFDLADAPARARFEQTREAEFTYEVPEVVRVRCNLYEQARGIAGALRLLPIGIPTPEELRLPGHVADLVLRPCGLVVVSGLPGSGRTSTLAALVDHVNRNLCCHIVTLEDPVEFRQPSRSSLVNQREVGRHTPGLAMGVRTALHGNADVVVTCEPRTVEDLEVLLDAATGTLVLTTLAASSAARAVARMLDTFPVEGQARAASLLADSLVAVLCQRLLPRADHSGRVLALEILAGTPTATTLIRERRTAQLDTLLRNTSEGGMQSMDEAVQVLVRSGVVAADDAAARPTDSEPPGTEVSDTGMSAAA